VLESQLQSIRLSVGAIKRRKRNLNQVCTNRLIPLAARSKARVCGRWLAAEIAVSNPAGGMDVCLMWVLCVVLQRCLHRVHHSSREFLPKMVCLSMIVKPR